MAEAIGSSLASSDAITLTAAQRQALQNLQKVGTQIAGTTQALSSGLNAAGRGAGVNILV